LSPYPVRTGARRTAPFVKNGYWNPGGFFFIVFAGCNGAQDLKGKNIFDIPILESLLLVISLFGLYLVIKGVRTALFRPRRYVLIVLFFTFLTYGGWMWSEILYDQQIITTFAVLQNNPETPKP
jgi:hypothetical protein